MPETISGDSSLAIRPSLIVIRTVSYLCPSVVLLQSCVVKGSIQEGRSLAPKSLQESATSVHWAVASFDSGRR